MRLLVVMIDLFGGTGTFCRNLANGLRRSFPGQCRISLVLLRDRGLLPQDKATFDEIDVLDKPVHEDWQRLFETLGHLLDLRLAIGRHPSDVILTVGNYANLLVSLATPKSPIVLTEHAMPTVRLRDSRFPRVMQYLMRRQYPRHMVVGVANGVIEDLTANFGVARTAVIYNGIDLQAVRALAEEPVGAPPGAGPYIVTCGRLTPEKNHQLLIRAFAMAAGQGLKEHLLIVGDGAERKSLEALAHSLGIWDRVQFVGCVSNPFPYLKKASFFVLPSLWEGFGYVLLEAMAMGLPCIATDCPSGPREILGAGEYGIITPSQDVASLSKAMGELSSSPDEQRRLSALSLRRCETFSLEVMAKEYYDVLAHECTLYHEGSHGTGKPR